MQLHPAPRGCSFVNYCSCPLLVRLQGPLRRAGLPSDSVIGILTLCCLSGGGTDYRYSAWLEVECSGEVCPVISSCPEAMSRAELLPWLRKKTHDVSSSVSGHNESGPITWWAVFDFGSPEQLGPAGLLKE